ncbi:MAG TPA: nucleoside triphosphate pyrophosphohydrolase [Gemmatimonadales bacterium]|nr:nucleoside triphosphate pyrophosphohydrolase [Gemmatimonadales bacterium]
MQGDEAVGRALALVRDLRARCAWDGAQTRATLRPYLVEEVLELDQTLRRDDPVELRDELGDLLLHFAFQVVLGEERREFDAESVTRGLEEKMWRRHPHLFGGGEKPVSWEMGKREEGRGKGQTLAGLPPTLPALLMAYRLQERAAGVGFDWPDSRGPLDKVKEEVAEVERATGNGQRQALEDEIGDLLFSVVNLARKLSIDPRAALERANDKFAQRFGSVEDLARVRGLELGRASLAELDELWEEIKDGQGGARTDEDGQGEVYP